MKSESNFRIRNFPEWRKTVQYGKRRTHIKVSKNWRKLRTSTFKAANTNFFAKFPKSFYF